MNRIGSVQTKLGPTFEFLSGGDFEQHPTYWVGNGLGCLPEHTVAEILRKASLGAMEGSPATGYKERFEKLDYAIIGPILYGQQGRFEFELIVQSSSQCKLFVNIPWRFDLTHAGTSQAEILANANLAVCEYWGATEGRYFELVSRHDGLAIPVIPRIIAAPSNENFSWKIEVYPDSTPLEGATLNPPFPHIDFVCVSLVTYGLEFLFRIRESFSFRPREDDPIGNRAGRGPHEVGHMMGIPHDLADRYTIMSTIDDRSFIDWRYSLGGDDRPILRPYAAHFKLAKVWAQIAFAKMNRLEDFIIRSPFDR